MYSHVNATSFSVAQQCGASAGTNPTPTGKQFSTPLGVTFAVDGRRGDRLRREHRSADGDGP